MDYKETIKYLKENENNRVVLKERRHMEIFKVESKKLYCHDCDGTWFEIKHKDPVLTNGNFVIC
jgi:uncharacterized protein YbaR (Trm112 family)